MVEIIITDHKAIHWIKKDGLYFRGWFFHNDKYYENKDTSYFSDLVSNSTFINIIKEINGNYACIYKDNNKTYIAVDRIRSFPIFYTKYRNDIYISDNVQELKKVIGEPEVEKEHLQEYMATGFVTGKKTIYKDIYQIQAGEYIEIDNETGSIKRYNHYIHTHESKEIKSSLDLCQEMDQILVSIFKRLIKSINGRPVVLFLSGGYDSRLVAVMLKRLNYKNVYCISFGRNNNKEVISAKNVANTLGLRWDLLTFPRDYFKNMLNDDEFNVFIKNVSNGVCTPYYQGILAGEFMKEGLIPKNSVIVTGNSGDLLEGDQFSMNFIEGNLYTKDQIIDEIRDSHYMSFGKKFSKKTVFREYISNSIEDILNKDMYSYEECHDILEFFNWRERQSKYVINDVRCYDDFLGNEWRLPLWDSEFMDFWLRVPIELRCNRKLYYEYIREEKFLTANNPTIYHKTMNYLKGRSMYFIELLYPFRKLIHFINGDTPFYTVDVKDFIKLLIITKGNRTNTTTTQIYMQLNRFYNNYFNKIDDLIK